MPAIVHFRRRRRGLGLRPLLLTVSAALVVCSGCAPSRPMHPAGAVVIQVPQQAATIQQAVDRARPGDEILVSAGVYRESVRVDKARILIHGADRDTVVVDGEFRRGDGIVVTGAGSAVENLTVRDNLFNGILFTGVTDPDFQGRGGGSGEYGRLDTTRFPPLDGFRASYVTAYDNGLYGVYAFDAHGGVIERSYASGQADSGIYVGQCDPCSTVVRDDVTERNAVGMEITNASGGVYVVGNRLSHNRVGLTLESDTLEALGPQHDAVVAGNAITDNAEADTPEQADGGFGIGLGLGGGRSDLVTRNLVTGNPQAGVLVTTAAGFAAINDRVTDNTATGNGTDLALTSTAADGASGNCLSGNRASTTVPAAVGTCPLTVAGSLPGGVQAPAGISFHDVAPPGPQPQQPPRSGASTRSLDAPVVLPSSAEIAAWPVPVSADLVPAVAAHS